MATMTTMMYVLDKFDHTKIHHTIMNPPFIPRIGDSIDVVAYEPALTVSKILWDFSKVDSNVTKVYLIVE
jgi:hypothetical protein